MVKPILRASDFSGSHKLPKNNPIERLHNMFCKQLTWCTKTNQYYGHPIRTRYGSNNLSCLKGSYQKLGSCKKQTNQTTYSTSS